jgi:hypothetical protein
MFSIVDLVSIFVIVGSFGIMALKIRAELKNP